jgi:hypothetical protein
MRIKKFNEDISNSESAKVIEFVKDCFVDFLDNGAEIEDYRHRGECAAIKIRIPNVSFGYRYTNEGCISVFNSIKEFSDITEEIRIVLDTIRNRYDEDILRFEMGINGTSIQIKFETNWY